MKKIAVTIILLLIWASSVFAVSVGQNLLQNSAFSVPNSVGVFPDAWVVDSALSGNFEYTVTGAVGTLAFKAAPAYITSAQEFWQGDTSHIITVNPNEIYEIGLKVRFNDVINNMYSQSKNVTVKLEWYSDVNYANIVGYNVLKGIIKNSLTNTSLSGDFFMTRDIRVPLGARAVRYYIYIDKGISATSIIFNEASMTYKGAPAMSAAFQNNVYSNTYARVLGNKLNVSAVINPQSNAFPLGTNIDDVQVSFVVYPTMSPSVKFISPKVASYNSIALSDTITPTQTAQGNWLYALESKADFILGLDREIYTLEVICHKKGDMTTVYDKKALDFRVVDNNTGGYGYVYNAASNAYLYNMAGTGKYITGLIDNNTLPKATLYTSLKAAGLDFVYNPVIYTIAPVFQAGGWLLDNIENNKLKFLYPLEEIYLKKIPENPDIFALYSLSNSRDDEYILLNKVVKSLLNPDYIMGWNLNTDVSSANLTETLYHKDILRAIDNRRSVFNFVSPEVDISNEMEYNMQSAGDVFVFDYSPNNTSKWTQAEIDGFTVSPGLLQSKAIFNNLKRMPVAKISLKGNETTGTTLSARDIAKLIRNAKDSNASGFLFDKIVDLGSASSKAMLNFKLAIGDAQDGGLAAGYASISDEDIAITSDDVSLATELNNNVTKKDGKIYTYGMCNSNALLHITNNGTQGLNVISYVYNVSDFSPVTSFVDAGATIDLNVDVNCAVKLVMYR